MDKRRFSARHVSPRFINKVWGDLIFYDDGVLVAELAGGDKVYWFLGWILAYFYNKYKAQCISEEYKNLSRDEILNENEFNYFISFSSVESIRLIKKKWNDGGHSLLILHDDEDTFYLSGDVGYEELRKNLLSVFYQVECE
jgi:hypothetical protein